MIVWAILAVFIPWVTGGALIAALPGRRFGLTELIGTGYLLGLTIVMAALYAVLQIGGGGAHPREILAVLAIAGMAAIWKARRQAKPPALEGSPANQSRGRSLLIAAILLLIFGKLVPVIASTLFVPVRGDDAISIWLLRAKVVTVLDQLPTDPAHPYYLGGAAPAYPMFLSLAAAWVPMVAGQWHETLAIIPWPLTYLSLILLVVGGLRRIIGNLPAWIAAYLVASLPLLLLHACRPGYADLPLATFLAAAILHLIKWSESRQLRDFAIGIVFALSAACLKREGPPLALIAVAGFLITSARQFRSMSRVQQASAVTMLLGSAIACIALVDFSEQSEAVAQFAWQPGVAEALVRHAFEWSSFGLFFPLLLVGLGMLVIHRSAAHRSTTLTLVIGFLAVDAIVFLLTPQGRFALNDQTPSRLFLQVAPAMILLMASSLTRPKEPA
jgi:hypothetical protein